MKQVYFARVSGTDGPIKIGCSSWPKARCKQLGFDIAADVEVLATAPGDYVLERNLHLKFAAERVEGPTRADRSAPIAGSSEWFAPAPEILAMIAQVALTGKAVLALEDCRERVMAARYKAGETLKQIGDSFGITRERVRQILHSVGVERRSATERAYVLALSRRRRWAEWEQRRRAANGVSA